LALGSRLVLAYNWPGLGTWPGRILGATVFITFDVMSWAADHFMCNCYVLDHFLNE